MLSTCKHVGHIRDDAHFKDRFRKKENCIVMKIGGVVRQMLLESDDAPRNRFTICVYFLSASLDTAIGGLVKVMMQQWEGRGGHHRCMDGHTISNGWGA